MTKLFPFILPFIVLTISACQKNKDKNNCDLEELFDRQEMVSHLTTQYIIPAYDDYFVKTKILKNTVHSFTQNPTTDGLMACRISWQNVALSWQNVAFLEFGPAENIGLRSQTNIYPIDTAQINNNINIGQYNLALPANYTAKGIQALDYLLHLPNKTHQDIVAYYISSTNATDYLTEVASDLYTNASSVNTEWESYSSSFINNTSDNAQGSATSNMVNALSAHFETFVRKGKVGIPVGIFNGFSQMPMPKHSEALYSNFSNPLLLAQMLALQNFINGYTYLKSENGLGFDDYMDYVAAKKESENLSTAINSQINSIVQGIEALTTTMSIAVTTESDKTKTLYVDMQKLVPLLKVDLTSALGVLVTYQDNDGD